MKTRAGLITQRLARLGRQSLFVGRLTLQFGLLMELASCGGGVTGSDTIAVSTHALSLAATWGFEVASAWTITTGTATKQSSTIHDEGAASLQVTAPGFVALRGDAVPKPDAISPLLALDVMVPTQAGPYYLGAVQMSFSVSSLKIYNSWITQRELSVPTGVWQTLTFQIPANVFAQLVASPFSDLQITIGLNSPSRLNRPFRFDNLRFVPAPTCVGQPNGTLCDDSAVCTTGNTCAAAVCGAVGTLPLGDTCDPGDDVLGFENIFAWSTTTGAAALAPSNTHVQGVRSLQITTPNFMTVSSVSLSTLHKVGQTISLRIQKPTNQPNPSWQGDVTLKVTAPSLGITFNVTRPLTGLPNGSFAELLFPVPLAAYQLLASRAYSDLGFSISINPPNGQSGSYLLDDLHFVPIASCTGVLDNTACEDNSKCTVGDSCHGQICGVTVTCVDGNICTDDSCNPATGCVFSNNTAPCSDGSVCTSADQCVGGACIPGPPISCDDGSNCTQDLCDATTGCFHADACAGGVCVSNMCCQPKTCIDLGVECGVHSDGCGGTVDCSSICPTGGTCNPAFRCLPPSTFEDKTGINICETLLEDLNIPEVSHSVFACNDYSTLECIAFAAAGQPCCVPVLCLADPICTFESIIVDVAAYTLHPGDYYCAFRSPEEYLEKILNGSIDDLEHFATMMQTGGLSLLFDFDIDLLTRLGRQAPSNARTVVRKVTESVYDGGATGFSYADLDGVNIVSSDSPTAGFYLPGSDRMAITMGPVIIMRAKYYDALFAASNAGVTFEQFVADPGVCPLYIAAVDILVHELVHVKQYRNLGRYNFTTQYLASALANGYGGIGFEQEAFNYEIMIAELQGGNYCSVMAATDNNLISSYGLSVAPNSCPSTGVAVQDLPPCP